MITNARILLCHLKSTFTNIILIHPHHSPHDQAGHVMSCPLYRYTTKGKTYSCMLRDNILEKKQVLAYCTHDFRFCFPPLKFCDNAQVIEYLRLHSINQDYQYLPLRTAVMIKILYFKCLMRQLAYCGLLMLFPAASSYLKFYNQSLMEPLNPIYQVPAQVSLSQENL